MDLQKKAKAYVRIDELKVKLVYAIKKENDSIKMEALKERYIKLSEAQKRCYPVNAHEAIVMGELC